MCRNVRPGTEYLYQAGEWPNLVLFLSMELTIADNEELGGSKGRQVSRSQMRPTGQESGGGGVRHGLAFEENRQASGREGGGRWSRSRRSWLWLMHHAATGPLAGDDFRGDCPIAIRRDVEVDRQGSEEGCIRIAGSVAGDVAPPCRRGKKLRVDVEKPSVVEEKSAYKGPPCGRSSRSASKDRGLGRHPPRCDGPLAHGRLRADRRRFGR